MRRLLEMIGKFLFLAYWYFLVTLLIIAAKMNGMIKNDNVIKKLYSEIIANEIFDHIFLK